MNIIYLDLINPKWLCTSKHCILQPYAILYVNLKNIKLVKVTQDDNYDIKFTKNSHHKNILYNFHDLQSNLKISGGLSKP
jgi:hypothetical protein